MDKRKGLLCVFAAILVTSFLCLCLYHVDNKYMQDSLQPINGILFFSEDTEYSYLINQWTIYPDTLLTPEDVRSYSGYRYYGDIGGVQDIRSNQMTYQLTLILPDKELSYALDVPEIFSSCHLYVNNVKLLSLGNPDHSHYKEAIGSQLLTFTASGETNILLQTADYSGVNRGMRYPMTFGLADKVILLRDMRQLLHCCFVLLGLVGAFLAFGIGIHWNKVRGMLSFILCICTVIVTGYPLYHGLFITHVQPWYTLEPSCYYAMLLCAVAFICSLYGFEKKRTFLLLTPCALGLLLTILRFSCASVLSENVIIFFSILTVGIKYYTAFALLILSIWALFQDKCHSILLLCGSSSFAVTLLWDRILPLYEPIYGGWFGEIGGLILVIFLNLTLWLNAIDAYKFRLMHETTFLQMEQRLNLQKEHYQQLTTQIKLAREAGHDLRHHMRTMYSLANQEQWQYLRQYLAEYDNHITERELTIWSDHPAADAILNHYAAIAKELNAAYDVRLNISPDIAFPDDELCIILSNLLENAVEALSRQQTGARNIFLRGDSSEHKLKIVIDNTFSGEINRKNDMFLSSKHSGTGLGISSVMTIVEKHGGFADFSATETVFHASVFIPLP